MGKSRIRLIVTSAIFGAIAAVLYVMPFLRFSIPLFPNFLEIHLDEIPLFVVGFAYGPLYALLALFTKTIIGLPFTTTLCVGELCDLLYSAAFVIPSSLIYKKMKTKLGLGIGLTVGTIIQLFVSCFMNMFVMFPFYAFVYGISMDQIQEMCHSFNSNVKDTTWSIALYIVLPFNLLKDALVLIVVTLVSLPLENRFYKLKK